MLEIFNTPIEVVQDYEVIRHVTRDKNSYVAWIGAGTSFEAGIKTAEEICKELRQELGQFAKPVNELQWAQTELNWDDSKRRYSTCLKKYGSAANRVKYFRKLIQGLPPVFAHHALALLMQAGYFKNTCLTTNFDKLMEIAFAQQGNCECQAIRSNEEAGFWRQEHDKAYVIKLHGDYDTHNILNTNDETLLIPGGLQEIASAVLKQCGLVVVGSAGFEESVYRLLNDLQLEEDSTILNMGLYWGIYTPGPKQTDKRAVEEKVLDSIRAGAVSREIVEMMSRQRSKNRPCAFFPVWGAGNFFFDLVKATENKAVIGRAERYLDHKMRLQHVFTQGGLRPDAISNRLDKLERKEKERRTVMDLNTRAQVATRVWRANGKNSSLTLEILYGDITSRSLMDSGDDHVGRRAVVSPEDSFVSASGGAALSLLRKAGQHTILNELSKFQGVKQREIVITSGGELPVNYIFHAAATQLDQDGSSKITRSDVSATMDAVFESARFLQVSLMFVPLIGSGEGIKPEESLGAILQAARAFASRYNKYLVHLFIVILDEGIFGRKEVGACMKSILPEGDFDSEPVSGLSAS